MTWPLITGIGFAVGLLAASPTLLTIPIAIGVGVLQFGFAYTVLHPDRQ